MLDVALVEKQEPDKDYLLDCRTLSAGELRRRYRGEANTHRNMLERAKSAGKTIHPSFHSFRDFLTHVGPRPSPKATLDRINNSDPEYGPGKVQWADKRTQNSNKSDTLLFRYSRTRDVYTVSRLAKLQSVRPSSIRKRLERGWTDDEIIEGRRGGASLEARGGSAPVVSGAPSDRRRPAPTPQTEHSRSAREIQWEKREKEVAQYRRDYGEEYMLADFDLLAETAAQFGKTICSVTYDRKLAEWLKDWGPHLVWDRLPQWAQERIARIEAENGVKLVPRLPASVMSSQKEAL